MSAPLCSTLLFRPRSSAATDYIGHPHICGCPERCAAVYHCGVSKFPLDGNHGVRSSTYHITAFPRDARRTAQPGTILFRPVVYKPTWWHPTFASRPAQAPAPPNKPYPLDAGHLSGMGDSDCAEGACRIARLSLPLCAPVLNVLDLESNVGSCTECSQYEGSRM
ncbi:hypothetical protein C8Q74DRAFT_1440417 [Fomes fomentarius]|nr:hypothetical protein C8Q74DRAFT_1440417 [Fomes fomentarius]